jgi:sugar (pentulose or hexulose) kinase
VTDRCILTVDLGSSGLRAYAVPETQPWVALAGVDQRYRVISALDGESLWRRFAPKELRTRLLSALAEAASLVGNTREISAISVTAQRGGTAFLDSDGREIYLAPNTDLRAVFEGAALDERLGPEIYATTGHLPSMFFTPAKLHWWREHHPRTATRVRAVATLGAWVVRELTGELAETPEQLAEAGLLDITTGAPSGDLLGRLEIDGDLLPRMVEAGKPTGVLTAAAAASTGLPGRTPVYLAGPDAQTAALGAGCAAHGDTCVIAGWSAPVQRVTAEPFVDAHRRTWAGLHPVTGRWVAEANPGDTGGTMDAIRRMLGPRMSNDRFDALAATAPERTQQVLAVWGPRALDLSSPGMSLGGLITPAPVTFDGIDRGTVARATLENIAFAIRECVALLDEVAPDAANDAIALTGGMARSSVFPAMLAAALGTPLRLHDSRAASTGAAVIASRPRADWPAAAAEIATHGEVIEPGASASLELGERYQRWCEIKSRLDAIAEEF